MPDQEFLQPVLPEKLGFLLEPWKYKVIYSGRYGLKCLALGTRVIMADGSLRAIEDVRKGEAVMGPDSKPRNVLATVRGRGKLYRVKQADAKDYVVSAGHILSVKKARSAKIGGRYKSQSDVVGISVEDFAAKSEKWRSLYRGYRVGLSFPRQPVAIDPYLLGIWLGDGTSKHMEVTTADPEVIAACRTVVDAMGGRLSIRDQPNNKSQVVRLVVKGGRNTNPLWGYFKAYGLANNKHIPVVYLRNSEAVRLELLAGLVDSDGTRHHDGFSIYQTRETLARDIGYLATSLGFKCSVIKQATLCGNNGVRGVAWRVSISGDTWRVPCRVPRKKINQATCSKKTEFLLSGLTIEDAGVGPWAGFTLDGDELFLLEDCTVTHNTRSCCEALLIMGARNRLRILCCREVMNSLRESVREELKGRIEALGMESFYNVLENEIRGINGTLFIFAGLGGLSVDSIKSYSNIDIAWVEEAHAVSKRSWDMLIPTIRKENSEIWVTFNPEMDSDDTYQRWVVNPMRGAKVVKTSWRDADAHGWFPDSENDKRLHCKQYQPDDYPNIWEGEPRAAVTGAIYPREMSALVAQRRADRVPYDPMLPVHTVWDLGWDDAMVIIMVQKPTPTMVNIINYLEDSQRKYSDYVAELDKLDYRWGTHYLPHDAAQKNPQTGLSAHTALRKLGLKKVRLLQKSNIEDGIRQVRMMFPRVFIDNSKYPYPEPGYLGARRLIECLGRYKRRDKSRIGESGEIVDDEFSHAADAFRALAMVVDQIRNDYEVPTKVKTTSFASRTPGMGYLS